MAKRNSLVSTVVLAICLVHEVIAGFKSICKTDDECPEGACCIRVRKFPKKINDICKWKIFMGQNCVPFSDQCCQSFTEYPPFVPQQQEHDKEFKKSFRMRPEEEEFPDDLLSFDSISNTSAAHVGPNFSTAHRRDTRDIGHWFDNQGLAAKKDKYESTTYQTIIIRPRTIVEEESVPVTERETRDGKHGSDKQFLKGNKTITVKHPGTIPRRETRDAGHGFDEKFFKGNKAVVTKHPKTIPRRETRDLGPEFNEQFFKGNKAVVTKHPEAIPSRQNSDVVRGFDEQFFKGNKTVVTKHPETIASRQTRDVGLGFDEQFFKENKAVVTKHPEAIPRRQTRDVELVLDEQFFKGSKALVTKHPKTIPQREIRNVVHGLDEQGLPVKTGKFESTTYQTIIIRPGTKIEAEYFATTERETRDGERGSDKQLLKENKAVVTNNPVTTPKGKTGDVAIRIDETNKKREQANITKHLT